MIARGRSLLGSLTSSPEVETASKPMYAKKISDAAVTVPPKPSPSTKNGLKLSLLKAVMPSTMNSASTTSLIATMIVLARAVSRTPIISTAATASTRKAAGRFTVPPSPGGLASASGSERPNRLSSSSLKYWPQPTATPAIDTPYSRIRSQPMIHAASSPSVAYE